MDYITDMSLIDFVNTFWNQPHRLTVIGVLHGHKVQITRDEWDKHQTYLLQLVKNDSTKLAPEEPKKSKKAKK